MAHANYQSTGSSYIVKGRGRSQRTIVTVRGPRVVKYWDPWKGYQYCNTLGEAEAAIQQWKKAHGLVEFVIFHKGKRASRG